MKLLILLILLLIGCGDEEEERERREECKKKKDAAYHDYETGKGEENYRHAANIGRMEWPCASAKIGLVRYKNSRKYYEMCRELTEEEEQEKLENLIRLNIEINKHCEGD